MRNLFILSSMLLLQSCAILYHVQVGQIDQRGGDSWVPFEIKVSEMGVSTEDIGALAKATNSQAGKDAAAMADIVALFQIGPRTGNPVYNEKYAEKLIYEIHGKCPSGRVSGLTSIREMRSYPVISGEIVKITGYCLKPRTPAEAAQLTNGETDVQ